MTQKLPIDEAYENGISFGVTTLDTTDHTQGNVTDIDWDQSINVSDEVLEATTDVVTQLHYALMSQLLMCGQILTYDMNGTTLKSQQLASILANYKIHGANMWGRYLGRSGGGSQVSSTMKQYYQQLFSETDVLSAFIGMEVLGGPAASAIYNQLQQSRCDGTVRTICHRMAQRKVEELETVVASLRPAIKNMDAEERAALSTTAEAYTDHVDSIIGGNVAVAAVLDVPLDECRRELEQETAQFLHPIRLAQ